MAKPYSMGLRERAIARVQAGKRVRSVAAALGISPLSVVKWSQRFRTTGSVAPGQMGGHRARVIAREPVAWLRQRIAASDFTLRCLVAEIAERGLKVDYQTV